MQYWIFFIGGVGGDGFSNLLEHSNNVEPADGKLLWRLRYNDLNIDKVAFAHPQFANDRRFLRNHHDFDFDLTKIQLMTHYYQLILNNTNTVIPAHIYHYNFNEKFKYWNILEKNQHKIWLYSNNIQRVIDDFCDKNSKWVQTACNTRGRVYYGLDDNPDSNRNKSYRQRRVNNLSKYDPPYWGSNQLDYKTLINIDRAWEDWDYLNNILISIGISLDRKYYEEYLDVSKRRPN